MASVRMEIGDRISHKIGISKKGTVSAFRTIHTIAINKEREIEYLTYLILAPGIGDLKVYQQIYVPNMY